MRHSAELDDFSHVQTIVYICLPTSLFLTSWHFIRAMHLLTWGFIYIIFETSWGMYTCTLKWKGHMSNYLL
jgi:hypothetical protein